MKTQRFTIAVARIDESGRPVAAVWRRTVARDKVEAEVGQVEAWARREAALGTPGWQVVTLPRTERDPLAAAKATVGMTCPACGRHATITRDGLVRRGELAPAKLATFAACDACDWAAELNGGRS